MPTLTTDSGEEIAVPVRLVVRMADRLHRLGPARRASFLEKRRRRLAARGASRNDAALILAVGGKAAAP
jgi:hypothetical protein